jgi:predicted CoA-binding protein
VERLREAARDFLSRRRLAVVGVSRKGDSAANPIYRRLRDEGYEVYPVNPSAETVEGDACYPTLADVPADLEGVVVATHPDVAADVARACVHLGVPRVWFHRSFGQGSVSQDAVTICETAGLSVLAGACPMMFLEPVDFGHRCIRWLLSKTAGLPEPTGFDEGVGTDPTSG